MSTRRTRGRGRALLFLFVVVFVVCAHVTLYFNICVSRDVISDWLYSRILIRKAREELANRITKREEAKATKVLAEITAKANAKALEEEAAKKKAERDAREEAEKNTYWAKVAAAKEKTAKSKAGSNSKPVTGSVAKPGGDGAAADKKATEEEAPQQVTKPEAGTNTDTDNDAREKEASVSAAVSSQL